MKKKILLSIIFWFLISFNNTLWFFPEYEDEITQKWEKIINNTLKKSIYWDKQYIQEAIRLIQEWKVNNKTKEMLIEYIEIKNRLPIIWWIHINLSNIENQEVTNKNFTPLWSIFYNRNNAVNYANQRALSRNPNYISYSNDCTNFTSQVLAAGWINYIQVNTNWYLDSKNWWYSYQNWNSPTRSWTQAHSFFQHAQYHTSTYTSSSSLSNLNIWDIIQMDWTGDWTIDHSAIITTKISNTTSGVQITYHSNDKLNVPLINLVNQYPNIKIYWWKVWS